jgi:hypothetical protein
MGPLVCDLPGPRADLDHTRPWHQGGPRLPLQHRRPLPPFVPERENARAVAETGVRCLAVSGQGVVSRLEHRDDMLLSTLYDYLMATEPRAPASS